VMHLLASRASRRQEGAPCSPHREEIGHYLFGVRIVASPSGPTPVLEVINSSLDVDQEQSCVTIELRNHRSASYRLTERPLILAIASGRERTLRRAQRSRI
jgi:hypothetical protein